MKTGGSRTREKKIFIWITLSIWNWVQRQSRKCVHKQISLHSNTQLKKCPSSSEADAWALERSFINSNVLTGIQATYIYTWNLILNVCYSREAHIEWAPWWSISISKTSFKLYFLRFSSTGVVAAKKCFAWNLLHKLQKPREEENIWKECF